MNYEEKDITIKYADRFLREFKRLSKKYRSLPLDFKEFKKELKKVPTQGASLGKNLHKVRLAITSKGGGKSGGARIITYVLLKYNEGVVRFLTIYDKSECSTLTDKELIALLRENGLV